MPTDNPAPRAENFRAGFVAIVGAPNVGKSTLLNRMLGQKISITSQRPQTTRNRILGILDTAGAQLVFLDTPGVHRTDKLLNLRIVETALSALANVDLVLVLADAAAPNPDAEQFLLAKLKEFAKPAILALNKIDLIPKSAILAQIDAWSKQHPFLDVVPISATQGIQIEELVAAMAKALPVGPALYPQGCLTDLPERFIAAEMIREKAFRLTGQEIPYSVAVTVDAFSEEKEGRLVKIYATLHLERESQKGIVIGKGGAKLKQIGAAARREIERMVGCQVFLKLFVRVQKNWSKDPKALRRFGY